MTQYINKADVVAELEKLYNLEYDNTSDLSCGKKIMLRHILHFLDSLEVKEVKEPNASDRGMTEEIIINLKRVEQDYRIDLTKEIEWLKNKVKKGE